MHTTILYVLTCMCVLMYTLHMYHHNVHKNENSKNLLIIEMHLFTCTFFYCSQNAFIYMYLFLLLSKSDNALVHTCTCICTYDTCTTYIHEASHVYTHIYIFFILFLHVHVHDIVHVVPMYIKKESIELLYYNCSVLSRI